MDKWIQSRLLYEYYIYDIRQKNMLSSTPTDTPMSLISFTRIICKTSECGNMSNIIYAERRRVVYGSTKKATFILLLNKPMGNKNCDDYSTYNGDLSGLTFSSSTQSPTQTPTSPPLLSNTDTSSALAINLASLTDDKTVESSEKKDKPIAKVQGCIQVAMDPLNLLADIAASFPKTPPSFTPIQIDQTTTTVPTTHTNNNNPNPNLTHPITETDFFNILPHLNFDMKPRINPIDNTTIYMKHSSTKTARKSTKWSILITMLEFGYQKMTVKDRKKLISAVATYHSYVSGYSTVICSYDSFRRWYKSYIDNKKNGMLEKMFENPRGDYKLPYITEVEKQFPGFLHECYRYATSVAGSDAQLDTLIEIMKEYSKVEFPNCPIRGSLNMTKYYFYHFFNIFEGKFRSPTTKPRLTTEHITNRLEWAKKWNQFKRLPNSKKHFVFLDEKWFYTTSRRRKQRILPPHPVTESSNDAFVANKKVRSRRHAVKVMFQGIITKPYPEHNFKGQISLKRVSIPVTTQKLSFNKKFDDSYHVTNLLKDNEWRLTCNINAATTVQEAIDEIQHIYCLYDNIAENLCFSYYTHSKKGKKKVKRMYMDENNGVGSCAKLLGTKTYIDENNKRCKLTLKDIDLHVRVPRNTEAEKDTTCDSKFMLESVDETGNSIRKSMHWIPKEETIFLFMDNAGGHGTVETKEEYVRILKKKYNILVEWQVPNSPETNLLDLGFWATHQAIVERLHRLNRMEVEALSRSVRNAFLLVDSDTIQNIFERWNLVLDLIIQGKGTNDLVETRRGLTKSLLRFADLDKFNNNRNLS